MLSSLISRRALALRLATLPAGGIRVPWRPLNPQTAMASLTRQRRFIRKSTSTRAGNGCIEALTTSNEFDAVTRLSDAITLVTAAGAKPTSISHEVGGGFTLFGGYVTGRNLEPVRDERLVQAWRASSWDDGDYSVAKFALVVDGAGTKLVFDHRGFPDAQGASLAYGWRVHYWQPLVKFLAAG